jgi:hypothetical protein
MGEARGGLSFQRESPKVLSQNFILTSDEISPEVYYQKQIRIALPALHCRKRGFRNHMQKLHHASLISADRKEVRRHRCTSICFFKRTARSWLERR